MKWEEFQPIFATLAGAFVSRGKQLFLVGGSVRDHLLGMEPKDFDFATSALPAITKEILESVPVVANTFPLGEKFGTIAANLNNGQQVEITTFRKDISAGRHPDVSFATDLKTDLERRDFTINSIAYSPDGTIIDPFNGQHDIKSKVIACTGDAFARFAEDPLRMLRAARFVSKLGFTLEGRTNKAIYELGNSILSVSRERWLEEMDKLLVGKDVEKAIDILASTRLLWFLVPELLVVFKSGMDAGKNAHKDLWLHTKLVLNKVPTRPDVRWAALLHDIAKPQTIGYKNGKIHFLGHDALGAEIANGIARRFKMPNDRRRAIRGLVFLHQRVAAAIAQDNNEVNMRVLRRLSRECQERSCAVADLVDLFGADCSSMKEAKRHLVAEQHRLLSEGLIQMREEDLRPKLPAGIGDAIMKKYDLKPGAEVGRLRSILDEMLVDGKISVEDEVDEMLISLDLHLAKGEK